MTSSVRLAAVGYQAGYPIDDLLRRVADRLRANGVWLAGVLQENTASSAGRVSLAPAGPNSTTRSWYLPRAASLATLT